MCRSILRLVLFVGVLSAARFGTASDLAIVGAKIYPSPSEPPISNGTVIVHDGRIPGGQILFGTDVGYSGHFDTPRNSPRCPAPA